MQTIQSAIESLSLRDRLVGPHTAGPMYVHIGPKTGEESAAQETMVLIGADILKMVVVTTIADQQKLSGLGLKFFCIGTNPESIARKYKLSNPEEGSIEAMILKSLEIESPIVFNALLDLLSKKEEDSRSEQVSINLIAV